MSRLNEPCNAIRPLLALDAGGDLDASQRQHVRRHLDHCWRCRASWLEYRNLLNCVDAAAFGPLPVDDLPDAWEHIQAHLVPAVPNRTPLPRWRAARLQTWHLAATCAVIMLLGLVQEFRTTSNVKQLAFARQAGATRELAESRPSLAKLPADREAGLAFVSHGNATPRADHASDLGSAAGLDELGMWLRDDAAAGPSGALLVTGVVAEQPADHSGLRPGDMICWAAGRRVHSLPRFQEIIEAQMALGAPAMFLEIERAGQTRIIRFEMPRRRRMDGSRIELDYPEKRNLRSTRWAAIPRIEPLEMGKEPLRVHDLGQSAFLGPALRSRGGSGVAETPLLVGLPKFFAGLPGQHSRSARHDVAE